MSEIICGDVLEVLRERFGDESVQCVVTSPPYWGLRDYGTAQWEGGEAGCDHRSPTMREGRNEDRAMLNGSAATNSAQLLLAARSRCGKCGAIRIDQQLGLEPTPEAYVAKMVEVFREVRRVLKADGTLWLNLGDSYASAWACKRRNVVGNGSPDKTVERGRTGEGLKEKDLVGIPWRVAFALQADGWYLRSDIIWSKSNPMPESVTDRPTKAHEYLFLLAKSERYYYDADQIREPYKAESTDRYQYPFQNTGSRIGGRQPGQQYSIELASFDQNQNGRNKRSVWEVTTQPYPDAHFATFPPKLIEPCILAGCPVGGLVLDPFAGSGTTLAVAKDLGRNGVGIELNPEYVQLAEARLLQEVLVFA